MQNLIKELYKCRPMPNQAGMALVLYEIGGTFVAIGKDADRLYLTLGWEITDFSDEGTIFSYMMVSPKGICVLKQLSIDYEIVKAQAVDNISRDSIVTTQQTLDYLRLQAGTHILSYPIVGHNTMIESVGFIREVRLTSLNISRQEITLCIDNSEHVELANGHEWNFSNMGLTLLDYISSLLDEQFDYILSYIQNPKQIIKEQKLQNSTLYNRYISTKKDLPIETILLLKIQKDYLAFDDDAITVASLCRNVLLYECHVIGLRGQTVAMLADSQLQALQQVTMVSIIDAHYPHAAYQIGLEESFLNRKYDKQITYMDVAIRKRKAGGYIISAVYNGTQLPEVPIPNSLGSYYCKLPKCKEKDTILVSLVHQTYEKNSWKCSR